jgi:hypothetical protein
MNREVITMRTLPMALGVGLFLMATASFGQTPQHAGERFFAGLEGEWVGTAQQRVEGEASLTRYFRLVVRRQDAQTFAMTVQYYRPNPKTGALEAAGSEQGTSTLEPDGTIQRHLEGNGSVLVDYQAKPESHSATGRARATAAGVLEGEASGTIRVEGMPLGLGRRGKIERGREEWSVSGGVLTGRMSMVACFRAFLISKRFKVETTCRAERGSDVAALAARKEIRQASLR